jgi:hypothetical protein
MTDTSQHSESLSNLPIRNDFLDSQGRPLTQSLFLENGYTSAAVYTLKDIDYEYKGKIYPSLKKLFLLEEDPTEYIFANKYLLGWKHWIRICDNKLMTKHVEEWRFELEMKLRSRAVQELMAQARKGNSGASKWLADRGWAQRGAGRPSKIDIEREKKLHTDVLDEYTADVIRLHKG